MGCDVPGGKICAAAVAVLRTAAMTTLLAIRKLFMKDMSGCGEPTASSLFFRRVLDRIEPVGLQPKQVP